MQDKMAADRKKLANPEPKKEQSSVSKTFWNLAASGEKKVYKVVKKPVDKSGNDKPKATAAGATAHVTSSTSSNSASAAAKQSSKATDKPKTEKPKAPPQTARPPKAPAKRRTKFSTLPKVPRPMHSWRPRPVSPPRPGLGITKPNSPEPAPRPAQIQVPPQELAPPLAKSKTALPPTGPSPVPQKTALPSATPKTAKLSEAANSEDKAPIQPSEVSYFFCSMGNIKY